MRDWYLVVSRWFDRTKYQLLTTRPPVSSEMRRRLAIGRTAVIRHVGFYAGCPEEGMPVAVEERARHLPMKDDTTQFLLVARQLMLRVEAMF